MQKSYKKYIEVTCKICHIKWQKRKDGAKKGWNGCCRKCSYKERNNNMTWRTNISKTMTGMNMGESHPNWVPPRLCSDCNSPLPKKSHFDSIRCKKCFDIFYRKENHWNWQNGLSKENHLIRHSAKYKSWAIAVKERDNYTCQKCNKRGGGELHSDHIKPFSLYPDLRFELSNGRTLCKECHNIHGWNLFKENNPRKNNIMKTILITITLFLSVQSFGQVDSLKLKTSVSLQVRDWLYLNSYLKNNHEYENIYDSVKAKLRIAVAPTMTTVIKADSIKNGQIIKLATIIKGGAYGNVIFIYTRINNALRATPYLTRQIDGIDQNYTDQYNQAVQSELDDLRSVLQ